MLAASVDSREECEEVAATLGFPIAYGVTREVADALGAWWDQGRGFIQPSEFVLDGRGRVLCSTYSSSPIGRMDPAEVVTLLTFVARRNASG